MVLHHRPQQPQAGQGNIKIKFTGLSHAYFLSSCASELLFIFLFIILIFCVDLLPTSLPSSFLPQSLGI